MQAIQNLGMALMTMMAGWVVDKLGYEWLEYVFLFWLSVALLCTIIIWVLDVYGSGNLNLSVAEREERNRQIVTNDQ